MLTKTLFNKQDLQFVNRKVKCNETTIYVFALTQCSTYRNSKLKFLNNVQKKLQLKKKKKEKNGEITKISPIKSQHKCK